MGKTTKSYRLDVIAKVESLYKRGFTLAWRIHHQGIPGGCPLPDPEDQYEHCTGERGYSVTSADSWEPLIRSSLTSNPLFYCANASLTLTSEERTTSL